MSEQAVTDAGATKDGNAFSGGPNTPEGGTGTEPSKGENKVFDADYVQELRNEAAKYRTERNAQTKALEDATNTLKSLEAKVAEFEKAKLTAEERAKLEFEESVNLNKTLQAQIQETRLEAAVAKNVRRYDLADVDATIKLLDDKSVEYTDDGKPSNIDAVLEATLEKYPFLRAGKKTAPDTGTTNPGRQKNNALTREVVQAMSHEERIQRMDEIQKWMQNGYK